MLHQKPRGMKGARSTPRPRQLGHAAAGGNALVSDSHVFAALDGAGRSAADVIPLLIAMAIGSAVIWLVVTGLSLYALRAARPLWSERAGFWLITVGGVVVPTLVLATLLASGMPSLARQLDTSRPVELRLAVVGEQWWWRVRYELPGGMYFIRS